MYLQEMKKAGLITAKEYETLSLYTDLTDVLIEYRQGRYYSTNWYDQIIFQDKQKFIAYIKEDLAFVIDAIKEAQHDRKMDALTADY